MKVLVLALFPLTCVAQGTAVDRSYCSSLNPAVDRLACVTEQVNARAALKAGELDQEGADYNLNRYKRCLVFTGEDQLDCEDRVQYGRVEGSVETGGTIIILKKHSVGAP